MIRINDNYGKLKASYLFADIARRVGAYVAANPQKPVIRLGIGDVTEPLPRCASRRSTRRRTKWATAPHSRDTGPSRDTPS